MRTWGPFSFYNRYISKTGLPKPVKDSNGNVCAALRQPSSSGGLLAGFAVLETPLIVSFVKWASLSLTSNEN